MSQSPRKKRLTKMKEQERIAGVANQKRSFMNGKNRQRIRLESREKRVQ
jgi:hypothetical protein